MHAIVAVLDVVILAALFVRVGREEITQDATATPELWNRPLSWWTQHRNTTMPPAVTGRRHQKSRIAESAATIKSNSASQV